MISLHRSMHSSQMYTPGPAMSFFTCFWLFPQKEHLSRSPPSPMRAKSGPSSSGPPLCGEALQYDGTASRPAFGPVARAELLSVELRSAGQRGGRLAGHQHLVDEPVRLRLLRREDLVALDVLADDLDRGRAVLGE